MGFVITQTTAYAAGEIAKPILGDTSLAKGATPPGGAGEDKSSKPCQCKVVDIVPAPDFFLSQDMPTGTSAGTDNQCRAACTGQVQTPGANQLGMAVTNYMQHKCEVKFRVYGKKAGNNYGGQNPDMVDKWGTGTFHPAVGAHCPANYSYPGPAGPTCVIDVDPTAGCAAGSWPEATYLGAAHPVCVKQTVPQGTYTGTTPWTVIGNGNPSNGGASLYDDHGGVRFFIDDQPHCPNGTLLTLAGYKPGKVCRKSIAAIPFQASSCTP